MSPLDGLERKYGVPKLNTTFMIVSQFELTLDDKEFEEVVKPIIPSESLVYQDFERGIDVTFRGRFITNLLPSVSKILLDLVFLPEAQDSTLDVQEIASNLLIANKEQFTSISPLSSFNLAGKFGDFKLPGPGVLNFNLKFIVEDKEVYEEAFPLVNTICSIPVILIEEGELHVDEE